MDLPVKSKSIKLLKESRERKSLLPWVRQIPYIQLQKHDP